MHEDLGMIHPEAQVLSICEFVELSDKPSASQIQWWKRHVKLVIDVPI